jgi:hypothetical protein
VFSNIQEGILQYYNTEVVLVNTIDPNRFGGIAPLILIVGTDGTRGLLHALTALLYSS